MPCIPAVILGSAFFAETENLTPITFITPFGPWVLFRRPSQEGWVSFRHGLPHRFLPHQVPWRAQAAALKQAGCNALMVTSSVGVLDPTLPLFSPLLVSDLLMLDARLGDGSACTMWPEPTEEQGHLVWDEGPFSCGLQAQVRRIAESLGTPIAGEGVHGWQLGPRLKTKAEHGAWRDLGAQVNSMSLAPEVVLANELEIPCVGLAVGHKHSGPDASVLETAASVTATLSASRAATEHLAMAFLDQIEVVHFGNQIYRFQ